MSEMFTVADHTQLDSAWQSFLNDSDKVLDDPYACPEYVRLNQWMEGGTAHAAYFDHPDGKIYYPFLKRELPGIFGVEGFDTTSPYGFSGPLLNLRHPDLYQSVVEGFRSALQNYCREEGIVCELVRFNPLLENDAFFKTCDLTCYNPKAIAWVDLTQNEETLWANLHAQKRRYLRKADSYGLSFSDSSDYFDCFKVQYSEAMTGKAAADFYHFSDEFFKRLQKLPGDFCWLHSALCQHEPVSTALFLARGTTVHYFLSANSPVAKTLRCSAYLIWQSILKAKKLGYKCLSLGGGLADGDELFRFKRQMSPLTRPYWIGTAIHDEKKYRQLTDAVEQMVGAPAAHENRLQFYRDYAQPAPRVVRSRTVGAR